MKKALLAVTFGLLGISAPAQANRSLHVSLRGCGDWATSDVERLIQLELSTVGGGESDVGSARVDIACGEASAVIVATEPLTSRSLSRTVSVSADADDAQRLTAISVAQLVRALDWLPGQTPAPQEPPRKAPRAVTVERPRPASLELQLGVGPKTRASLVTYGAALASGLELRPGVRLGGGLSYERGDAQRELGSVDAQLLGGAVQAGLEPWRGRNFSCLVRLELGLQHLTLTGEPRLADVQLGRTRGFGGEAELAIGPVLRWDGIGLALLAQAGGAHFGGEGLVSGAEPVTLNGGWVGAELALLWAP